jgi:hypothetical protein
MTNRDPNKPEFIRKFQDLYNCMANYFSLPDEEKRLHDDLTKKDIDLVCYYEIRQLQKHITENPWAIYYSDFVKTTPNDIKSVEDRLKEVFKNKL